MIIWYYNHYSGDITTPKDGRSYYLTKAIRSCGQSPVVITASYHHLQKSVETQLQENALECRDVDGVPFVWLKVPFYKGNGFSRIKNMLTFAFKTWKHDLVAEQGLKSPDVIIISSVHPFHLFSCLKWAKKYKAKLVFEVRDLWPLSLNLLLGLSKWHPLHIILSMIERIGYRKADLVISPLKNALLYMKDKGLNKERFLYLPNGYIADFEWSDKSKLDNELQLIRSKYKRVIMHTGSMGIPNGLELFISAANNFSWNDSIAFVLIGKGELEGKLKQMASSTHIYFFDAVPKSEVLSVLSYSDACYCGSQNLSQLYKYGVSPNKIFDYMLAKKTIILAIDSPGNPVELSNAGFFFKPVNAEPLLRILEDIESMAENDLAAMGKSGFDFLKKEHDFDKLALTLIKTLETL